MAASTPKTPKAGKKKPVAPRIGMPVQPPMERIRNFTEVALGYSAEQARAEAARCLHCRRPMCVRGCPVEVPIRDFIHAITEEDLEGAYAVIKGTNSLPAVCGRVCPQEVQCEGSCVLGAKGEPVAIGRLERFVADSHIARTACEALTGQEKVSCEPVDPNLKVACIGSGPSSLTVAGYLSAKGVKVTVYEALHEAGGVLIYGIPEFRLPKDIVRAEIEALKEHEVDFVLNWVGGKTFTIEELFEQGCKAVFVGVGAGLPRFLDVIGENLLNVFSANEYLTRVNLGRAYDFPNHDTPIIRAKQVCVIGGGNVAMDAARTALRLGAEDVFVVYRRTREEMPARLEEVEHALEEGVKLACLCGPIAFLGDDQGRVRALKLQRMRLGEPDETGRRRPECVEGDVFEQPCDLAILAVGTGPNRVLLESTPELSLNRRGYVVVNEETGETSIPNVFAGGDIVTGSATVISAMGAGRRAAKEILRRLKPEAVETEGAEPGDDEGEA